MMTLQSLHYIRMKYNAILVKEKPALQNFAFEENFLYCMIIFFLVSTDSDEQASSNESHPSPWGEMGPPEEGTTFFYSST